MKIKRKNTKESCQFYYLHEFGGLELLNARYYQQSFARHVHETYCIGVIEEGAQRFYRTGSEHIAPKGDIILVNADEVHTGSAEMETGWSYRAIYPHPELLLSLSQDMIDTKGYLPWFPKAVVHDPILAQQLRTTFSMLLEPKNQLLKETLLLSALSCLITQHSKKLAELQPIKRADNRIKITCDIIQSSPEKDYSLTELATQVQLSPWYFLRLFKKSMGMSPHCYLMQQRLRKAKQLLQQHCSIIAAAYAYGFTDQSHFTRHFKNTFGITPGQFLRSLTK